MNNNFTFVTGYTNLQEYEERKTIRGINNYLMHSITLFKTGLPIVFYCHKKYYYVFDEILKECPNVLCKTFEVSDFKHNNNISLNADLPIKRNINKDTNLYMITILQKVYWLEDVSNENPFNSKYFCWIDIGINHVLHENSTILRKYLLNIDNTDIDDRIIIPSNWKLDYIDMNYCNNNFHEYLMGGVIASSKEKLKWLSKKQYETVEFLLKNENKLTWEINYWLDILKQNKEYFGIYYSQFNHLILSNFPKYIKL